MSTFSFGMAIANQKKAELSPAPKNLDSPDSTPKQASLSLTVFQVNEGSSLSAKAEKNLRTAYKTLDPNKFTREYAKEWCLGVLATSGEKHLDGCSLAFIKKTAVFVSDSFCMAWETDQPNTLAVKFDLGDCLIHQGVPKWYGSIGQ